jgi:hypothetical protein
VKFFVTHDLSKNRKLKTAIRFLMLFLLLFLIAFAFNQAHLFGLLPGQIVLTLHGNETLFIDPATLEQMVEFVHIKLFLFLFCAVILQATLFALANTVPVVALPYVLLFLDTAAFFAARYLDPLFAYLQSGSFLLLLTVLVGYLLAVLYRLRA